MMSEKYSLNEITYSFIASYLWGGGGVSQIMTQYDWGGGGPEEAKIWYVIINDQPLTLTLRTVAGKSFIQFFKWKIFLLVPARLLSRADEFFSSLLLQQPGCKPWSHVLCSCFSFLYDLFYHKLITKLTWLIVYAEAVWKKYNLMDKWKTEFFVEIISWKFLWQGFQIKDAKLQ